MALRVARTPGVVERTAWRVSSSSRRFFLVVAVVVASSITLASVLAAVVTARNAAAVATARDRGEEVASSITEFREHLSRADAQVAGALVAKNPVSALGRATYEAELIAASRSLTNAGVAARGDTAEAITELAGGLDRYARLVETARSYLYPVGSVFHDEAGRLARTHASTADRLRISAEDEIVDAADEVVGLRTTVAVLVLMVALVVLVGAAVLVAGRTRIRLHPALVLAGGALVVELVVVITGLWSQRDEMQEAASGEIDEYVDAHDAATTLFDLRSAQTMAVASDGEPAVFADSEHPYDYFAIRYAAWVDELDPPAADLADPETLPGSFEAYAAAVDEVERLDRENDDHDAAVEQTLDGGSAITYRSALGVATSTVGRKEEDLTQRLDDAATAGNPWSIPILLGVAAAALATTGVLRRARGYL